MIIKDYYFKLGIIVVNQYFNYKSIINEYLSNFFEVIIDLSCDYMISNVITLIIIQEHIMDLLNQLKVMVIINQLKVFILINQFNVTVLINQFKFMV